MKKCIVFVMLGIGSLVLLSGCYYQRSASPGSAVEPWNSRGEDQRVVTFRVIGKGLEPENSASRGEALIMAERAAVADGYRQLGEKLSGVFVEAYMKSGWGTVDQDAIRTMTQTWLRGVDILEIKNGQFGIVEAHMNLRVNFTRKDMVWWPVGIGRVGNRTPMRGGVNTTGGGGGGPANLEANINANTSDDSEL